MNFKIISALYKKEILDIFRDKKTIMIMLVVPLLLYPAIMFFAAQISVSIINDAQQKSYDVVLDFEDGRDDIIDIFNDDTDEYDYSFNVVENVTDCPAALAEKSIDAYVTLENNGEKPVYKIYYLSSETDSANVSSMLEDMLLIYRNNLRASAIDGLGYDSEAILYPVDVEYNDTASSEQSVGYLLGAILPVILVVIIVMSATYPATDITAGEKERGTLETLLTLPLKSQEIFTAKFLAVTTIAVFSAMLNIASMGIVAGYMYTSISAMSGISAEKINISSFIPALAIVIVCVIIFATFVSAVTMGICSMAKSFKEAQNYMTPLTFIIMIVGYISFIPNVELNMSTAIIPVLNICLLIKQLLNFEYNFLLIAIVLISNLLYAFISVMLLGKMYNSENIMFEESSKDIKLFERRADIKAGGCPGRWDAFIILLVAMIGMIYISALALKINVLCAISFPQIFFLVICFGSAWYLKCDIKRTFSIKMPSVRNITGGIVLAAGMLGANLILSGLLSNIMKDSTDSLSSSMDIIDSSTNVIQMILIVGILPAICEEILFRGYLYSSVKDKVKPVYAMLIVSVVFGIYHMNFVQSIVTAVIGMFLVYALYRTDSIFIPMLMHCINNTVSVLTMKYPDNSVSKFIDGIDGIPQTALFIIIDVLLIFAGIMLTGKPKSRKTVVG